MNRCSIIEQYGIKLSSSKCNMFQKELSFLGYHISQTGIKPESDKLKVIENMQF